MTPWSPVNYFLDFTNSVFLLQVFPNPLLSCTWQLALESQKNASLDRCPQGIHGFLGLKYNATEENPRYLFSLEASAGILQRAFPSGYVLKNLGLGSSEGSRWGGKDAVVRARGGRLCSWQMPHGRTLLERLFQARSPGNGAGDGVGSGWQRRLRRRV